MRILLVLGGLAIAIAISLLIPALETHGRERAAWAAQSARVGTPSYSAAQSDLHHARSENARLRIRGGAQLLGVGFLLLIAGWRLAPASGDSITEDRPVDAPLSKRALVTAVDGGLGWSAFLLAAFGDSAGLWDTADSGTPLALEAMAPALLFLPHAGLLHGHSLGLAAARCRFPGSLRTRLLAALLGPAALPILMITLHFSRKRPVLAAVHLRPTLIMNAHSK